MQNNNDKDAQFYFEDLRDVFDKSWKNSVVKKTQISKDRGSKKLSNYGIFDYFSYNDNVYQSKMIAAITNDYYVIDKEDADKDQHLGMHFRIEGIIGHYECWLGSDGSDLAVFLEVNPTVNQLNTLIGVFNELRSYYLSSGIDKKISFIGVIESKFNGFNNCSKIDEIIIKLTELKNQIGKEQCEVDNSVLDISNNGSRSIK